MNKDGKKLEFKDMINKSGLEFVDISSEIYRAYLKDNTVIQKIDEPIALNVNNSGGHRVLDARGNAYYIKPEWDILRWKTKEGLPHFVA